MNDTIRKRHADRVAYAAALASRRASSAACPACHDSGIIQHEEGELPCPYCRPCEAAHWAQS